MRPANLPMSSGYYQPGPERAAKVRALFDRIAPRYDLINDLQSFGLHRRWKHRMLELAQGNAGQTALDVCCGTGDLALSLVAQGLQVIGLDFSFPMLEIARTKALCRFGKQPQNTQRDAEASPSPRFQQMDAGKTMESSFLADERSKTGQSGNSPKAERPLLNLALARGNGIQLVQGDAQQLPFGDAQFNLVTIGYGLRNLADWEQGLCEMARVLKPGGKLLVLDFGKPTNGLWRSIYFGYLRLFVPVLGLVFCGSASAYAYILQSLLHYPAQQGVANKMRELGMNNVRIISFLGGVMAINYGEKV